MASKKSSVVIADVVAIRGKKKATNSSGSSATISTSNRDHPATCTMTKSKSSYLVEPVNYYEKKCSTMKDPSCMTSSQKKTPLVNVVTPLPEASEEITYLVLNTHSSTVSRFGSCFGSPSWETAYTSF